MSTHDVFASAQRLQTDGTPYALVSVVRAMSPTSARPGDKALVTADGRFEGWVGGGCAQPAVLRTVRQSLADGRARLIRIAPAEDGSVRDLGDVLEFGMACHSGGTLELFVDPVLPRAQLLVIGDSPVAQALAGLAPRVGFTVDVVAHGAERAAFPDARRVFASDDAQALAAAITPGAFVVVATQGRRDLQGLAAALAVRPRQVSFIASARKAGVLRESLVTLGHDADAVAAIVAPAGYPIAASTPEEIALSVLASVVAVRRRVEAAVEVPLVASSSPPTPAPTQSCCGEPPAPAPTLSQGEREQAGQVVASCCQG